MNYVRSPFRGGSHGQSRHPGSRRASADYTSVCKLHADFHKCASQVIECVGHNDKAKADALMAGDYAKISSDLTPSMMKWKAAAH